MNENVKYKDYTDQKTGEKTVNAHYVGERQGTPLGDALAPDMDGYEHMRDMGRFGTITQDALNEHAQLNLDRIEITKPATKLTYKVGDNLDLSGLEVTGHYSGGAKMVETITPSCVTGFNSADAAEKVTLTITISGKTVTYDIAVTE